MSGKEKNKYPRVTTWDIYKEYWKSAKLHWVLGASFVLFEILATVAMWVVVPMYYKDFFDLLPQVNPAIPEDVGMLIKIIVSVLVINICGSGLYRVTEYIQNLFFVKVGKRLVEKSFSYLIDHSHTFFINHFSGSLVQKINRFYRSFGRIADNIIGDLLPLFIKVLGASVVLMYVEITLSLIVAGWVIIVGLVMFYLARFRLKYDIISAEFDTKLTGTIADAVSNQNSIQLFTGHRQELELLNIANSNFYKSLLVKWNLGTTIDVFQAVLAIFAEFAIFYFGIKYWQLGTITLGTFILVQLYVRNIGSSLWGFNRIIRNLYEATADAREMVEILHLPHEISDSSSAKALNVEKGAIEFKNVTFAFGQNKPVFTNLNLSIKPGEKVALIGSSGAGKSTFVKLLLRLHDIQGGEILIDEQNIAKVTQESLRESISLVPQDPALFHRTLMENIRYGQRDAKDEEVIEASKLAHCDIFIKDFPTQYETLVGERGIKLSGGERQRVAIARALLKNAPILVLDEATSSLDSHSESLIQDALHTLMQGKTTLVIAHRLSTIKKMDRIIVLGKDGILEEGSHDELLTKNGTYSHLWSLQVGGFTDKSIEELLES